MLPLAGVKVLDLTTVAMGPFASQWMGDFGADVIKIETPDGDSTRSTGPGPEAGMAAMFLGTNRNKRSIVLDLRKQSNRGALLKLVDTADVLMHNIRPQKLKKLGLEPKELLARRPSLIFAGLHGFAESGPYGGRPAYDDIIQGLSGCADLMHRQNGETQYFPSITADKTTGLIAAMAVFAALYRRSQTGTGGHVEIPMFESMVAFNLQEHFYGQHFLPPLGDAGYPRALSPYRRPHKTLDGYISMMPHTDAHWQAFFEEAGAPKHALLTKFSKISCRTKNIDELYALAAHYIEQKTTEIWIEICLRRHIPASPILKLDELVDDPHLQATNFLKRSTIRQWAMCNSAVYPCCSMACVRGSRFRHAWGNIQGKFCRKPRSRRLISMRLSHRPNGRHLPEISCDGYGKFNQTRPRFLLAGSCDRAKIQNVSPHHNGN